MLRDSSIAIIAHVDHGKTTLLDLRDLGLPVDRVMNSDVSYRAQHVTWFFPALFARYSA